VFHWNALQDAETYRQTALDRAARGGSTVRVFKSAAALELVRPSAATGTAARAFAEAKAAWRGARIDALEQFRFAVYGDEWADLAI
jgi:hypothetical protein